MTRNEKFGEPRHHQTPDVDTGAVEDDMTDGLVVIADIDETTVIDEAPGLAGPDAKSPVPDDPTDPGTLGDSSLLPDLDAGDGRTMDAASWDPLGGIDGDHRGDGSWDPLGGIDGDDAGDGSWDPLGGVDDGADGATPPGFVDDSSWAMDGGSSHAMGSNYFVEAGVWAAKASAAEADGDHGAAEEASNMAGSILNMGAEELESTLTGLADSSGVTTSDDSVHEDHEDHEHQNVFLDVSDDDEDESQTGGSGNGDGPPVSQSTPIPPEIDDGTGGGPGDGADPALPGGDIDPVVDTVDHSGGGRLDTVSAGLGAVDDDPEVGDTLGDDGEIDLVGLGVGVIDPSGEATLLGDDAGDLAEVASGDDGLAEEMDSFFTADSFADTELVSDI